MPLNDYRINGRPIRSDDWTGISTSGVTMQAIRKSKGNYFLKRYNNITYPVDGDPANPRTSEKVAACEKLLRNQVEFNRRLKEASGRDRCFAYAEDVFLNKTIEAPGVVEAVPFIQGALKPEEIRKKPKMLHQAMLSSARALERLHAAGIVHSDLKLTPPNILFVLRGGMFGKRIEAIFIDFDTAYYADKTPGPDGVGGTPEYMAPEVAAYINDEECSIDGRDSIYFDRISPARDVFSLGVVFHELLTGRRPDADGTLWRIDRAAINAAYKSDYLCDLIDAMLQFDPSMRPDAATVADSLEKGKLCFTVEAFEALWPEHEEKWDYAKDLKRYARIRRASDGAEHQYAVHFQNGEILRYTIQMLNNTGIVTQKASERTSRASGSEDKAPMIKEKPPIGIDEKLINLDGITYQRDMIWEEDDAYAPDPAGLARWGYLAFYRTITADGTKGYAVMDSNRELQQFSLAILKFKKCVAAKR